MPYTTNTYRKNPDLSKNVSSKKNTRPLQPLSYKTTIHLDNEESFLENILKEYEQDESDPVNKINLDLFLIERGYIGDREWETIFDNIENLDFNTLDDISKYGKPSSKLIDQALKPRILTDLMDENRESLDIIQFTDKIPDYPKIASVNDKIIEKYFDNIDWSFSKTLDQYLLFPKFFSWLLEKYPDCVHWFQSYEMKKVNSNKKRLEEYLDKNEDKGQFLPFNREDLDDLEKCQEIENHLICILLFLNNSQDSLEYEETLSKFIKSGIITTKQYEMSLLNLVKFCSSKVQKQDKKEGIDENTSKLILTAKYKNGEDEIYNQIIQEMSDLYVYLTTLLKYTRLNASLKVLKSA